MINLYQKNIIYIQRKYYFFMKIRFMTIQKTKIMNQSRILNKSINIIIKNKTIVDNLKITALNHIITMS